MFYSRDKTVQRLLDFNPKENGFVRGPCWTSGRRPAAHDRSARWCGARLADRLGTEDFGGRHSDCGWCGRYVEIDAAAARIPAQAQEPDDRAANFARGAVGAACLRTVFA